MQLFICSSISSTFLYSFRNKFNTTTAHSLQKNYTHSISTIIANVKHMQIKHPIINTTVGSHYLGLQSPWVQRSTVLCHFPPRIWASVGWGWGPWNKSPVDTQKMTVQLNNTDLNCADPFICVVFFAINTHIIQGWLNLWMLKHWYKGPIMGF